MTSKPASGRALCLTVAHCSHPDLDPTDKALLMYLALSANYGTGQNARPGNQALCDALKLGRSAVNDRLTKNIERGLIQRTHEAHGRKLASVFRICIEHPAFPDRVSSSGEWLIEEKTSGSTRTFAEKETSGIERTFPQASVRPAADKCPVQGQKMSGDRAENVRELAEDTKPAPETHQLPTNNNTLPEWVGKLFFDHNQETVQLRKIDRDQFMAAIKQHGEVAVAAAWREFIKTGWYNAETKFPAYVFFKDGAAELYIQGAIRKLKIEREQNDPARIAAIEASVQRQKEEQWKLWTKAPKPENGGDVLEYLAELDARQDRHQDDLNKASADRYADAYAAAAQPVVVTDPAQTSIEEFLATA